MRDEMVCMASSNPGTRRAMAAQAIPPDAAPAARRARRVRHLSLLDLRIPWQMRRMQLPHANRAPAAGPEGATVAVPDQVRIEVHPDIEAIGDVWRSFEASADCTAFQTFDWLSKWQRHIGARRGTRPAIVIGRDAAGEVLFILQLAIETRGGVRRLVWLGADLCDYNAPLLRPGFSAWCDARRFAGLWKDVLARLQAEPAFRFDLIDLRKMPEGAGHQANPLMVLGVRDNPNGAYLAELGTDWESYYAARRSGPTRKREKRQLRQLAECGAVTFVEAADHDAATSTLETLFSQKREVFARRAVADIFARPGVRDFYLDLATDPHSRDLVHVSRLDVGAETAATSVGLRFRSRYYLVLSSYDVGPLAKFGPGRAHLHELLRRTIDDGFSAFDFTIGDEPYKRDWANVELRLHDHVAAAKIRGWPVVWLMVAARRAERAIKQDPRLWQAFGRLRAALHLRS